MEYIAILFRLALYSAAGHTLFTGSSFSLLLPISLLSFFVRCSVVLLFLLVFISFATGSVSEKVLFRARNNIAPVKFSAREFEALALLGGRRVLLESSGCCF